MKTKDLKKGSVLSEASYFVTEKVLPNGDVVAKDDTGRQVTIGKAYVENVLVSADLFETVEKKTATEIQEIFLNSPRVAMTVNYTKQDTVKGKRAYEAEKAAAIEKVKNASLATADKLLADLIDNPISKVIPGEQRTMKGRHTGIVDTNGRVSFIDMELPLDDAAGRYRLVDPRTIAYIIVNGVKYERK